MKDSFPYAIRKPIKKMLWKITKSKNKKISIKREEFISFKNVRTGNFMSLMVRLLLELRHYLS